MWFICSGLLHLLHLQLGGISRSGFAFNPDFPQTGHTFGNRVPSLPARRLAERLHPLTNFQPVRLSPDEEFDQCLGSSRDSASFLAGGVGVPPICSRLASDRRNLLAQKINQPRRRRHTRRPAERRHRRCSRYWFPESVVTRSLRFSCFSH